MTLTRNTAWDIVTDHPEIFESHVVPKLNGNDVKFFYDVNRESRRAIQRSGVRLVPRENGCPWNKKTCEYAAHRGHLECLKYAHENGCPWDKDTCWNAAAYGQLECNSYARSTSFFSSRANVARPLSSQRETL